MRTYIYSSGVPVGPSNLAQATIADEDTYIVVPGHLRSKMRTYRYVVVEYQWG